MKSFWAIAALVVGLISVGTFAYATSQGKVFESPSEEFVPKDIRKQPNGYRSFHFWHVGFGGYRGGK